METDCDTLSAIGEFRAALPGWWFSICECSVSCDASCGPDRAGPDAALLENRLFDEGFHADLRQPSSLAVALRDVLAQGLAAKAAHADGALRQDGSQPGNGHEPKTPSETASLFGEGAA